MKPILIARNKTEDKEPPQIGVPWETFVGGEVLPRRVPWSSVSQQVGKDWSEKQQSYNSDSIVLGSNYALAGGPTNAAPKNHTHAPSDITCLFKNLTLVTNIRDTGEALQVKLITVTAMLTATSDESDWQTFAETTESC